MMRRPPVRRRRRRCRTLAEAAGLGLGPPSSRTPLTRSARPSAAARVGTLSRATVLQLLRDQEPADRRGRHGHHGRRRARRARCARTRLHGMSQRRLAPLPARRRLALRRRPSAGLKANMTDLQAAIGRGPAHARSPAWQAPPGGDRGPVRRSGWPGCPGSSSPHRPAGGRHAWHIYAVRIRPASALHRDALVRPAGRARGSGRRCTSSRCTTSATVRRHRAAAGRPARRRPAVPASCSRCRCTRGCPTTTSTGCATCCRTHWVAGHGRPDGEAGTCGSERTVEPEAAYR